MSISEIIPPLLPHFNTIWSASVSQSLIAAILGNLIFFVLIRIYRQQKGKGQPTFYTQSIEYVYEKIYEFLSNIGWEATNSKVITFTTTIFFYVLRANLFGLIWDMVVLVWPAAHAWFRPVTTDVLFNAVLATMVIVGMFGYGFAQHGFHFINKYLPINGMGIVKKVDKPWKIITKFLDILLGLLIWIIELLGEFGKILSLSLRLFWNMFVGMLLLILLLYAMQIISPIPLLGPIVVFGYEACISLLQALIFAILSTVYFRLAWEAH